MKKLFTFLLLGIFMIGVVNALDFDNIKSEKTITFDGNSIIGNKLLEKYKPIEIKNAFGLGEILFEGYLDKHDETCGQECSSTIKLRTGKDGVLIDDIIFKTLQDDGDWVEQDVRSYQFKYWGVIDDYETQCVDSKEKSLNGTISQTCSQVKIGEHEGWINYEIGEELPKEEYTLKLEAEKKPSRTVDWIIKTNGEWLDSWAVWGNISEGDDAEVILNSPTDGSISLTNEVTFNATANVTSGASLTNMSLWTNQSGNWELKNTSTSKNIFEEDLISYYKLDETGGTTATDSVGSNDGTISGATYTSSGKIEGAYDFEVTENDYIALPNDMLDSYSQGSISMWVKLESNGIDQALFTASSTTDANKLMLFRISADNTFYWSSYSNTVTGSSTLTTGTWYNIILTSNGSTSKIYLNGVAETLTGTNSDWFDTWASDTMRYDIGVMYRALPDGSSGYFDGIIDEVGIWSRALTSAEVTELYNSGNGKRPTAIITNLTKTFNQSITNTTIWNVEACDSDGDCGFATSNYTLFLDLESPTIDLESPTGTLNYGTVGSTEELNVTFTDTGLDSCWYDYNGTNVTIDGCLTGIKNSTTFILEEDNFNMTIYANDGVGNLNSSFIEWDYKVVENDRTYSESTFETQQETFSVNVTTSSTPTAKFIYNGTQTTATAVYDGTNYIISKTIDIPIGVGDNDFYFNITLGGDEIKLDNSTQEVNLTFFTPTNATYATQFLNISFKDENSLEPINMTIPFSEFVYYLGSGSVNKTMNFVNTSENYNYLFSGTTGSLPLKVLPVVQYRKVDDYPQRIWEPEVRTYNSTLTNQVLYSLSSVSGIFVTYQVLTAGESPIENVEVTSTRQVSGTTVQVGAGLTDSSGLITFWMNPDFQHSTSFNKEGFTEYIFSHFPTQTAYTITLGDQVEPDADCGQGILQTVRPSQDFLFRNTEYDFNYTISSSYHNLTNFQITLTNQNGTVLGTTGSSTSTGGTLSINNINTTTSTSIIMTYLYEVDNEDCSQVVNERVWITQATEGTEFSIWQLVQDADTYISVGLFGFDNFGKTLISFVVIVLMVGGISKRYGIASEGAVMGMLFGVVFLLDVGLGFIPAVNVGTIASIEHFFTYITFIMLLGVIIREERR